MNVNRSQKRGPILHYITQAKSRTTKITVMHHTLTHFNTKSVKNHIFAYIFSVESWLETKFFLVSIAEIIHSH